MSHDTIRLLLIMLALYLIFKTVSAPKRGSFLTLFGNVRRETQPSGFLVCLIAGYALATIILLAAIFPDIWLPAFERF